MRIASFVGLFLVLSTGLFAQRAKAGELKIRLLLTSAGDEQYRGDDAKLLAARHVSR